MDKMGAIRYTSIYGSCWDQTVVGWGEEFATIEKGEQTERVREAEPRKKHFENHFHLKGRESKQDHRPDKKDILRREGDRMHESLSQNHCTPIKPGSYTLLQTR